MNAQQTRQIKVIATMALGHPNGPRVDLNIKALNSKQHSGECLLITIQEASIFMNSQEEPITVFKGCRTLDLFSSRRSPQFLGSSPAPEGDVSRIKLSLSRVALWISKSKVLPVSCIVGEGNVLELAPGKPLRAQDREVLSIALLFDTELSLKEDDPLIRIEPVIYIKRLVTIEPYIS